MKRVRTLIFAAAVFYSLPSLATPLEEAQRYFQEGDYKASIIEAKNALQQNPGDAEARLLLGRAYLALYKGAEAEKEFLRAKQLGVPAERWKPGLARALFYQGKNEELLRQLPLDEALSADAYAKLAALRADAALALKKIDQAHAEIEKGEAKSPDQPDLMLSKARLLIAEEKQDQAREILTRLVQAHPDNAEAHASLGALAKSAGDDETAVREFKEAVRLDPYNISAHIGLATLAISRKAYDEAEKELDEVLALVPGHLFANYLYGLVQLQQGHLDEAGKRIDYVLEAAPDYKPAVFVKGTILLNEKKYEQADRYLTLYLQSHPDNTQVTEWLAYARIQTGDYNGALKVLERFGRKGDANILALRGMALMGLKRFDEASKAFEAALEKAPGRLAVEKELALARLNLGDTEAVESLFKEKGQMGELLFVAKMRKKDYAAAEAVARRLIEKKADNPVYRNMLGLALLGQNKLDDALRAFRNALKIDEKYLTARFNLARAYDLMGRLDEAERQYAKINELQPVPAAYIGLANIAMKRGDDAKAERYLKEATKLDQGAVVYLAKFYIRKGRMDEALALLEGRDDVRSRRLLIDALVQAGKLDEAIDAARRLPENPRTLSLLGRLYLAKGDPRSAEDSYRKALELAPDFVPALAESARVAIGRKDEKTYRARLARLRKIKGTESMVTELEGDRALAQGKYAEAMGRYERLIKRGLSSASLWRKYDLAAQKADALERARKLYAAFLERHPDEVVVRRRYAVLLQHLGDDEAAAREYEKVIETRPDPIALNNLAWIYVEAGDEKGLDLARRAFELAAESAGVADTYGWALIRFGQVDKGVRLLKEWLTRTQVPDQLNDIRYHLAYGLLQSGRVDEAQPLIQALSEAGQRERVDRLKAMQRRLGSRFDLRVMGRRA